jgi:hypothetical protein
MSRINGGSLKMPVSPVLGLLTISELRDVGNEFGSAGELKAS